MTYLDFGNIGNHEIQKVTECLKSGYVSTASPIVSEFEKRFAEYLGCKDVVATNSGTSALHLSLVMSGVGPGDEVIIPATTFIATANVVKYVGATPVIVDIDPYSWCISPSEIEKAITKKTKVIIPVHLYGNPCDMVSIKEIAKAQGLIVIEDASESLGCSYPGVFNLACYSFNGNKTMTTGGGGMIVANRDLSEFRKFSQQAKNDRDDFDGVGYNYRMPGLNAALGLAQMDRLDSFLKRKAQIHDIYVSELSDIVIFQKEYVGCLSSWWYTCITSSKSSYNIFHSLKAEGIPSRYAFKPIDRTNPFWVDGSTNYNADSLWKNGLCLPSSTLNTDEDILTVCKAVRRIIEG